jgi:hypothetical protein
MVPLLAIPAASAAFNASAGSAMLTSAGLLALRAAPLFNKAAKIIGQDLAGLPARTVNMAGQAYEHARSFFKNNF